MLAVACVEIGTTDLGDGYYYTWDYPLAVCKRVPHHPSTGVYVLPPHDGIHDDYIAVNIYWDDEVVLAVCCENYHSTDSTCYLLLKGAAATSYLLVLTSYLQIFLPAREAVAADGSTCVFEDHRVVVRYERTVHLVPLVGGDGVIIETI